MRRRVVVASRRRHPCMMRAQVRTESAGASLKKKLPQTPPFNDRVLSLQIRHDKRHEIGNRNLHDTNCTVYSVCLSNIIHCHIIHHILFLRVVYIPVIGSWPLEKLKARVPYRWSLTDSFISRNSSYIFYETIRTVYILSFAVIK